MHVNLQGSRGALKGILVRGLYPPYKMFTLWRVSSKSSSDTEASHDMVLDKYVVSINSLCLFLFNNHYTIRYKFIYLLSTCVHYLTILCFPNFVVCAWCWCAIQIINLYDAMHCDASSQVWMTSLTDLSDYLSHLYWQAETPLYYSILPAWRYKKFSNRITCQWCTTWRYNTQDKTRHDMTWHDMTEHDMTWHEMTWHDMKWHDMTWNDITWHHMTWHNTSWYHIMQLHSLAVQVLHHTRLWPSASEGRPRRPALLVRWRMLSGPLQSQCTEVLEQSWVR